MKYSLLVTVKKGWKTFKGDTALFACTPSVHQAEAGG